MCKETALQFVRHSAGHDDGCCRISVSGSFGNDHDVGLDAVVLDIEPLTASPESRLGFIDNKEEAAPPRRRKKLLQIILRGKDHAAGRKHRLNDDGGDVLQVL